MPSANTHSIPDAPIRVADYTAERYVPTTQRASIELDLRRWIPLKEAIIKTKQWNSTEANL